ncbi:hypothetical protein AAFF_G00304030 [Aldrovandia affinis]|uniref:Uncharacterized protein n=1 Tax=Aldrovandia affinis TaxID=143900 RepID=A0AAD7SNZ2_9TELE|nr:hypothetical protein AAFF_G00304030 [Aldrovandia affinis]
MTGYLRCYVMLTTVLCRLHGIYVVKIKCFLTHLSFRLQMCNVRTQLKARPIGASSIYGGGVHITMHVLRKNMCAASHGFFTLTHPPAELHRHADCTTATGRTQAWATLWKMFLLSPPADDCNGYTSYEQSSVKTFFLFCTTSITMTEADMSGTT